MIYTLTIDGVEKGYNEDYLVLFDWIRQNAKKYRIRGEADLKGFPRTGLWFGFLEDGEKIRIIKVEKIKRLSNRS